MKKTFVPPPLLFVPVAIPYLTGYIAKCLGRKFWPWFFLGLVLPVASMLVLVCLREKNSQKRGYLRIVENEKLF